MKPDTRFDEGQTDSAVARLIYDTTYHLRTSIGTPTGVSRVEREFIRRAHDTGRNVTFVYFDPYVQNYRVLEPSTIEHLLGGNMVVDPWALFCDNSEHESARREENDPHSVRVRRDRGRKSRNGPDNDWRTHPRRRFIRELERVRRSTASRWTRSVAERLQRLCMSPKYRRLMLNADGSCRDVFYYDDLTGPVLELRPPDVLVCAGFSWFDESCRAFALANARAGVRLVLACHDIIPLQFPLLYHMGLVRRFRDFVTDVVPVAHLIVVFSHRVAKDVRRYCSDNDLALSSTAVAPLGLDIRPRTKYRELPEGIKAGRYALFVGTADARKGHQLLYNVWLRLLQEGIPQRADFKLVLVGRHANPINDPLTIMRSDGRFRGSLLVLTNAEDDLLATLYQGAAFCLFPSIYEGFGLPIVEAFSYGKAVISSTGGALPEVVRDFSPCLDPQDEGAWYEILKTWIQDPTARAPYEIRIRSDFRHPTWSEAADQFFSLVEQSVASSRRAKGTEIEAGQGQELRGI